MSEQERNRYLEAYYENEADANKQMSFANAAAAVYMAIIWVLYLTGIFKIHSDITRVLINIAFPIGISISLSPLLYVFKFKEKLKNPGYKNFVVFSFVAVVGALNLILPIHSVIAWALCIVMTNHYYNPKVGLAVFITIIPVSLLSMYGAMFVGEFDANLLIGNEVLSNWKEYELLYIDGPEGRRTLLRQLLEAGENRYLQVIYLYYLPRLVLLGLIFFVSNALNKRTYKLLVSEISVNSEQEKTKTELEVAKEIQLATLPYENASSKDAELIAELKAAKEVGGDFYDYFQIDDTHTAVVVGDISGKGIPAAMFMMKTITCFKNYMAPNKTAAEILKQVNKALYSNNRSQMFVTCFLAILDKKTGVLQFANAGHNPPIIGTNFNYRYLKCKSGFVLGGLEDAFVVDESIQLEKGESITIYTDGVTEARDEKGALYGEERFLKLMNSKDYTCLLEIHHSIKDDMAKFCGVTDQSDDITILSLKWQGDDCDLEDRVFDGKLENVQQALDFVEAFCDKENINREFKNNLSIVTDEIISNIIKYGYENKGGPVYIRLLNNRDKKEFVLTMVDKAPAFNQLEIDNDPLEGSADDKPIGGLGILIVKKIMTEYAYDRINNKNILILRKKF